ncbi:calcium/sodium antiporter [Lentisalinibacter orientalis]|uniref:calcium/sodium antiporter n=1 Tax=Lentisalinibacter orientalis TaxID=2992241 RepID=UPI00386B3E20
MLLQLGGGLLLLVAGAEMLIKGAVSLGERFGLSSLVIGLTVVAFGTSAPELVVSVDAALAGYGGIAVGNVVGSNICNLALILGAVAVLRPAGVDRGLIRGAGPVMIAAAVALVVLLANGRLSRLDGLLLTAAIVIYTVASLRSRHVAAGLADDIQGAVRSTAVAVVLFAAGLALLLAGGSLFVKGGAALALTLGVAPAVVGLTVMAAGTSMPELATSVVGAVRGQAAMATGNIIGSNIFNALAIPGIAALVTPIERGGVGAVDLGIMLVVSVVALGFMYTGSRLTRAEGAMLLAGYVGYCAWLFVG